MEAIVSDLERQLTEQEKNANDVISEWQASFTALDEEKSKLAQTTGASEGLTQNLNDQLQETRLLLEESTKNAIREKEAKVILQGVLLIVAWFSRSKLFANQDCINSLVPKHALPSWNQQWQA